MASAGVVGDISTHGGTILGPGCPTVLIGGKPALIVGDMHQCGLPPTGHQPTISPFIQGSATVVIGGMPAVRTSDMCVCGACPAIGEPTVVIG